jgi:tryptophan 2,3-dioxygenase
VKKEECQNEIGRELGMRKKVYPAQIQAGKLHKAIADKQMTRMTIVWTVLEAMTEQEFQDFLKRYEDQTSITYGKQLNLL